MTFDNRYFAGTERSEERDEKRQPLDYYTTVNRDGERIQLELGLSRVIFINEQTKPSHNYPTYSSIYAVAGIVEELYRSGNVGVRWDNGLMSRVNAKDLAISKEDVDSGPREEKTDPNKAFKLEKQKKTPGKVWSNHSGWRDPTEWRDPNHIEPNPEYIKKVRAQESDDTISESPVSDDFFNEDERDR